MVNDMEAVAKTIMRVRQLEEALTAIYNQNPRDHMHDYPCMVDEIMRIAREALKGGNDE